jgi:hypothetical protein
MTVNPYESPKSQGAPADSPSDAQTRPSSGPECRRAVGAAIVQQAVVLVLAALVLDGGRTLVLMIIAAIGSWVFTLIVILRRPRSPTRGDILIIKYGIWLAAALVVSIVLIVGRPF